MKNNFSEAKFGAMRTAFLTAYPKIFTDIEYSTQIFAAMKTLALKQGFAFEPSHFNNEMAVEIEARHKALNKALAKHITKDTLVIEIAAGLSPRHLQFKEYDYVELDLKPVVDIKKDIYIQLGYKNLAKTLFASDVTDEKILTKVIASVVNKNTYKKVIIVNEGLFWYLTKENIALMVNTFSKTLSNIDWLWITSDCPTVDKCDEEYRNVISKSAKVKRGKTFEDYKDFTKFFQHLGLNNTRYKLSDFVKYNNISSAKFFSIDKVATDKRTSTYTDIAILKK